MQDSYITDNVFPSGYIQQLQPALHSYVAATAGYLPPDPKGPFTYLEMGCGTGVTLNVLAASNPESRFVGIDFNPAHIEIARDEAADGELENVSYIEGAFEQISIADLPECDYMAIHGAYSWLPPEAVEGVHRIVTQKLRTGGIFFLDYLSAPTRVPISPLWVLLRELVKDIDGSSEERVAHGMEILRRLNNAGGYLAQNPSAQRVLNKNLKRIDNGDRHVLRHLAHHALAEHQEPKYSVEIQATMRGLGLQYAGSSATVRNDPALCLPPGVRELCSGSNPAADELVKDFILNENQRKDLFIKAQEQNPDAAREYLRRNVFLFPMRPAAAILNRWTKEFQAWKTPLHPSPVAECVLECLDRNIESFEELVACCSKKDFPVDDVVQALNVLLGRQEIHLCRERPLHTPDPAGSDQAATIPFNLGAERRSREARRSRIFLASSVLGSGLPIARGPALAFQAFMQGKWPGLRDDSDSSGNPELPPETVLRDFENRLLPRLRRLGIVSKIEQS